MWSPNSFTAGSHPKAPSTNPGMPASVALLPQSVVAFGGPREPAERLMGLQSAVARAVQALASLGRFRLQPAPRDVWRFVSAGSRAIGWHL